MVHEASERGAGKVSVAHVVERSGVSRRTFYEIFDDRESCFLAAFDEAVARAATVVIAAYEQRGPWQARMRGALTALLELLDYDRDTGRLLIVESLAAGSKVLEHRERVLTRLVTAIDQGRNTNKTAAPPPLTAEGVAGGMLSILHARLTTKSPASLIDLTGPLMGMIVLPYLGPTAARTEIEQPTPKPRPKPKPTTIRRDPLRDLEMRLTYRTVRTLISVAEHPGSSNRQIGKNAGIPDQGQISKLLTRLHNLGLIQNTSPDTTRGEPNAWTLTTRGWEIHEAVTKPTPNA